MTTEESSFEDDQLASMTTEDIARASRLLDNENRILKVVGILDYGLAKVADQMIKFVITPAVSCRSRMSFIGDLRRDRAEMAHAVLKMVPSTDPEVEEQAKKVAEAVH